MNEKEIYAVYCSIGSYDDYFKWVEFVTKDKEIAERWVEKYNRVLKKWKVLVENEEYRGERYWDIWEANFANVEKVKSR